MDKKQKLISELEKLQECWKNINDLYDSIAEEDEDIHDVFAKKYPFERSFDEYIWLIENWIFNIKNTCKGQIIYTEDDGYEYISPKGIKYSLYEGMSVKGKTTSDICFIMNDNYTVSENLDYMFVGWFFGATFISNDKNTLNTIYNQVADYEANHKGIIEMILREVAL